jgi:polygalacturonase
MRRIRPPRFPQRTFDITDYGACPNNVKANVVSQAFALAIAACAKAGGGRVLVPAGNWLSGAIHLRSNVELHLAKGAELRFSTESSDYLPPVFVRWGGQECFNYSPFIYARDCTNIAITGAGTIVGQGDHWVAWPKPELRAHAELNQMAVDGVPVEDRRFGDDTRPLRPQLILAINCTGVLMEGVTIAQGGPQWTLHAAYCQDIIIRGLEIRADAMPNNVGIVIDSCSDALIEDCTIHTGDDCIALKSGLNEDGWRVGKPTENVTVRRVRATSGHGGITIGSEMSGGVRNVLVHDCHYDGPSAGIRLKASRGRGGVVEDILVHDIVMGQIPGDAIQITTEHSAFVQPDGKSPTFRNIQIRNVTCQSAETAVRMIGLADSPLREISLANVTITAREGLHCSAINGLKLLEVHITPSSGPVLSLKDSQRVLIDGLNGVQTGGVFLDLRGRQTREICLKSNSAVRVRPVILLGIDVPRDALVHE